MATENIMHRNYLVVIGLTVTPALAAPAPLAAQEAPAGKLAALLAEAEANTPQLVAARKAAEAAAARVPQAGALPDPILGVGVTNLPVADPRLGQDFMTMASIGVSELFPFPGKLGLREAVARYQAQAAEWEAERVRQRALAEVKATYYELYFIDQAQDITGRNEALVGDFARLTAAKYGVGTAAQSDVLKAQVERTRLEDQLVDLREKRATAAARLNALLGRPTAAPLPDPEIPAALERVALAAVISREPTFAYTPTGGAASRSPFPSLEELQRLALEHNPMIQAHVRRIAGQEKAVSLAEKARLPDFHVSVGYAQRSGFGDMLSAKVSVPLPIFSGRKQDQQVLEEAAVLAEQQARHHAMVNELNAEIASLAAELERDRAQLLLLNEGILPQARASLASANIAYQVGNVDFLTLLDSQVTLYRHELDYHRLLSDFAQNVAALERAVGTEVLP